MYFVTIVYGIAFVLIHVVLWQQKTLVLKDLTKFPFLQLFKVYTSNRWRIFAHISTYFRHCPSFYMLFTRFATADLFFALEPLVLQLASPYFCLLSKMVGVRARKICSLSPPPPHSLPPSLSSPPQPPTPPPPPVPLFQCPVTFQPSFQTRKSSVPILFFTVRGSSSPCT
jgi:hypothetical protein